MSLTFDATLHRQNLGVIASLVGSRAVVLYAAWGSRIEIRPYLKQALREIVNLPELANAEWMNRGLTAGQHPRHPLGTPRQAELQAFDITTYLSIV